MLHLLPLRLIAKSLLYVTALTVFGLTVAGLYGPDHIAQSAFAVGRIVLLLEFLTVFGVGLLWRYIPGFLNRIYPDISGTWNGFIRYSIDNETKKKPAVLHVHQDMTKIRLILETDESQSETLVALPEKDEDFSRFKLFYIFENTRKEAADVRPGEIYRGTAFIEMGPGRPTKIDGSYFTDQRRSGSISFSRDVDQLQKWRHRLWNGFLAFFAP